MAWVGDANNVARSLALACALAGVEEFAIASPAGYELDKVSVEAISALGAKVVQSLVPAEAAEGADAIFTDVWVSMGQEAEAAKRAEVFRPYQVGEQLMAAAAPAAVFLHCLPAHRGQEVTAGVIDGPTSLVWPEAANRLRAMRGLLLFLFGHR